MLHNASVRINKRADPGICSAGNRAAVLYRAQHCHGQMLIRSRGAAKPGIIGNVYQKTGSILGESAHQVRENDLIADESAK